MLELLDTCVGDDGSDARWRLTLRGIDVHLDDLGLELEALLASGLAVPRRRSERHALHRLYESRAARQRQET